jgi:ADP-L-glycero-D-manno-heptose 6-epimerase
LIIVTGGAGFIGSNLVARLEEEGHSDIVICDRLRDGGKWRNIAKRMPMDIVHPDALGDFIEAHAGKIRAIYHMGAISSTTATDGDEVLRTNFAFSVALWRACARHGITFIYASSAATYGDGAEGFMDSNALADLRRLRPLNLYGWSKWLFDGWVLQTAARGEPQPPVWSGLRFFNVYGPNEYHKGTMQSLVSKIIAAHRPGQPVTLFKSHKEGFADGEQLRDFVYVTDVVAVMVWLGGLGRPGGILNLGTGQARSFHDLAVAAIRACGEEPRIHFVDMPEAIRNQYQYFTCADMGRLRALGYNQEFVSLETGVTDYVTRYLIAQDRFR